MKKITYILSFLLISSVTVAQEKKEADDVKIEGHYNISKIQTII